MKVGASTVPWMDKRLEIVHCTEYIYIFNAYTCTHIYVLQTFLTFLEPVPVNKQAALPGDREAPRAAHSADEIATLNLQPEDSPQVFPLCTVFFGFMPILDSARWIRTTAILASVRLPQRLAQHMQSTPTIWTPRTASAFFLHISCCVSGLSAPALSLHNARVNPQVQANFLRKC